MLTLTQFVPTAGVSVSSGRSGTVLTVMPPVLAVGALRRCAEDACQRSFAEAAVWLLSEPAAAFLS